jgi:hypothetical protein
VRLDDEQRAMLDLAMQKAQRLVDELVAQQAEIDANPPKIAPADLVAGRTAMQNAVASARRTLTALRDAERVAREAGAQRTGLNEYSP